MLSAYLKPFSARVFAMASNLVCGLIALKLYGRLTPAAYGVVVVALTVMGYLPLLDGGFRTTISRAVLAEPNADERRQLLRFGQVLYSWLGFAVLAMAVLLMVGYAFTPTGRTSGQPLSFFLALAAAGAMSVIGSIQAGVLVGLQAQSSFFLLTATGSWVSLGALWFVLSRGGGVWAFPISTASGVLAAYPVALWLIRQHQPDLAFFSWKLNPNFWNRFQRLRTDAWHCFQSQISIVVLYTVDIILVGFLCSPKDAAIYGILSRMFAILRGFLQSMSEISWPMIAQRGWANQQLNRVLNRMNAWAVGSVTGALCLTLAPFVRWYDGEAWSASNSLVWLMAARFMITSFAAPAAYLLYGSGDFRSISRCLNRELLAGVAIALPLGRVMGVEGIAWAFLVSTTLGTLYPIFRAYAVRTGESLAGTLVDIWIRGTAGLTISLLCTRLALGYLPGGRQLILAGGIGMVAGLATSVAWSAIRTRRDTAPLATGTVLRLMKSI